MGMGRNGRTDLPRGSTERSPPLSRTVSSRPSAFELSLTTKLDDLKKGAEQNHERQLEKILRLEKGNVMRDSYSKRLDILFHGIQETEGSNETKEQTKTAFENLLKDALQLESYAIKIVDVHRLPQ